MRKSLHLSAFVALLLAVGTAAAGPREGEWVSYRDAYRAMVVFEKYGKPKNLIQNHYQVAAKDQSTAYDGVQLALRGKSVRINLALDATGRVTFFPLLKAAYDENAELVLSRPLGALSFRPRVSIVARADGVYEAGELRAACEQALAYQRHVDASARGKKCVGVHFAFAPKGAGVSVKLRAADSATPAGLPVLDGAAFGDGPGEGFKTVSYRFGALPDTAQVLTQDAPLAISALFE
ncbi:hypothetical protein [Massilia glaciei]|uniref:DUF2987 domain-containing protein n=1 Tax=Massilia glaciei TaxID=1524097 RepID=A0A2U2I4A8_9BURK|nr:hypothetical protein [Massilia glaciei]PWF54551.1 hypothetical protein C7C56_006305 [Massilia glaciei]